ncbi:MAG: hypothetical protein ACLPX7_22315 [Xanthobacteraceae bacterium]
MQKNWRRQLHQRQTLRFRKLYGAHTRPSPHGDRQYRIRWGTGSQTKPFTALEHRPQRILNTLFKELEKRGFKIKGEAPWSVSIEIGREKLEFALRERFRQVRRPLNDEEKAGLCFGME